jgi:endonuclease/exonuclease/phosphatase family metal-dependent hydrolase
VVSQPAPHFPPPPSRPVGRSNTVNQSPANRPTFDARSALRVAAAVATTVAEVTTADPVVPQAKSDTAAAYPDVAHTNRRPPWIKHGAHEIATRYDSRIFDVCGQLVCTGGHLTRVWSLLDGELLMSLSLGEGIKATSISFKPGAHVDDEGTKIWMGNNSGDILEAEISTGNIMAQKGMAHGRYEVIKIYRHYNELWTLDEGGTLHVWGPGEDGMPSLNATPHQSYRVPKGHSFSMVVGDELWHATGKDVRIFLPSLDGKAQFQVMLRALYQESAGDVTSGAILPSDPKKVFIGHADGKVSIYSRKDYSCLGLVSASTHKINSLTGVGKQIWAGYNNGRIAVYDIAQSPWVLKKEWQAHDNPVMRLITDRASAYKLDRLHVASLGADNMIRVWDGMLQDDWLEEEMQARDRSYCDFEEIKAMVMTWNAGASTPSSLRHSPGDSEFIQDLLRSSDSPDILIFSFQELVDLEDKTATARRFLKPKKKEGSDQERMSHQYRDWRDCLVRSLDDFMAGELYQLLQTAHLVGLFTCIFVKADLRDRVRNLASAEVKRGMGGLHGNKGAIAVRFMVDDTSLCFVNCHLAAGQTSSNHRHNDANAILEAQIFATERDPAVRIDSYVGGGDAAMVLDHELVVLNGDLNYRIDTMSRDTVVAAVKAGNLAKLLERDQLLVARRRTPSLKLRVFEEMPIGFAPTYKYDVGTDTYDTSEKRRSPAWCDRLLYRGGRKDRIRQVDYRRHEVRVSDHRPVTGRFRFQVKKISPKRRAMTWMECQNGWEDWREKGVKAEK